MFEVAQAEVRNWEHQSTDGIFLSFHLRAPSWVKQLKPSCKFLKRGRHVAKDPSSVDFEGKMRTTQVVQESQGEMTFRAADMDSTTHLFMMTGPGWNVRRGDKVILVCEVYRRQMQAGKDLKLTKFRNEFTVGTVGEVILAETIAMAKKENLVVAHRPHVVLEVRASWSQGFVLDNARPSFADAALLCLRRPTESLASFSSPGQSRGQSPTGEESIGSFIPEDANNASDAASQASDDNSDQGLEGLSCSDWIPSDWTSAWGSPWPGDDDKLQGKHPVVPLMEAEFKKDCIIMYNTLFPNVRSQIFMTLRDLALSNFHSRLAWRTCDGNNRDETIVAGATQSLMRGRDEVGSVTSDVELFSPTSGKTPVPSIGLASQDYPLDMPVQLANLSTFVVERGGSSRTALVLRQSQGKLDLTEVFDEYSVRSMFLKRLFICFAFCGVYYSAEGNAAQCRELWPYPLASILTHGTRMLIQLVDVEGSEFMNYLFFGSPSQENPAGSVWPMNYRIAATHAVVLEEGHLVEKKLEAMKVTDSMQNIADGLNKKHMGLNLPIGGVGNPSPLGSHFFVGFTGDVVKVMKPLPRVSTIGVRTSRASRMVVDRYNTATTAGTSSGKTIDGQRTLTGNLTFRETTDGEPEENRKEGATDSGDRRALLMPPDWSDSANEQHRQLKEASSPKEVLQLSARTFGEASDAGGYASGGTDAVDTATPVRGRRNSFSTPTRLLTGSAGTTGIDACGLGADYKVISGVQCGHLYCRMDTFGEYIGPHQFPSGLDCTGHLWRMLGTQDVNEAHLRLVHASGLVKSRPSVDALLATVPSAVIRPTKSSSSSSSGSILGFEFADKWPRPSSQNLRNMYDVWHTRRLSRVRSEPPRRRDVENDPTHSEMRWLQTSLKMKPGSRLAWPPSESALRLLLELFNPDYLRLFGMAKFRSIYDLYQELSLHRRESLVKGHSGLVVVSERVMLKIRWKGHFLVCADVEREKGRRPSAAKSTKGDFITASSAVVKMQGHGAAKDAKRLIFPAFTLLQPDSWQVGTSRWVQRHFAIAPSVFIKDSLSRGVTHSVNEEMLPTSACPGLSMLRRTYIVTWDVQGRAAQHFQKYDFMHTGLLDEHMKSMQTKARLLGIDLNKQHKEAVQDLEGCPFCTVPLSTGSDNSGFPETEDSLMHWLWRHQVDITGKSVWMLLDEQEQTLFSELPEAEVWAKSLLKKDGILPVPPSEVALSTLLQLSIQGSRTQRRSKNGKGGNVRDLWMELLLQQSYLLMHRGHVYHVVEEVVIRIRGRHKQKTYTLVQETEKGLEDWHLPKTRKLKEETWREATLKWLTSRFTKVDPSTIPMEYAFVVDDGRSEVLTASMPKLLRWHLVTISLRDDITRVPFLASLGLDDKLSIGEKAKVPIEARLTRWMLDSETIGLRNAELFKRTPRRSTISSVLIGLEGSGPNQKGAFNQKHSTTGQSGKVSAVGSRKWRAYRVNSALEVPAEFGSIRMTLDRATFKEFMDKCDSLNLRDPIEDLAGSEQRSCDRHSLWREHVEQEFFKLLLSSNGQEAKEALESILCEQLPSKRPGMHRSL